MHSKEELLKEYREIIKICETYHLDEYLEQLYVKLQDLEEPLKFMIVGEGKSGKSTLLNALVGKEIAEVDDEPKTWCINVYRNTEAVPYVELIYADGTEKVSIEQAKAISKRIGAVSHKQNGNISEKDANLREMRWHLKLDWPKADVMLIDTPGFDQVGKDAFCKTVSIDGLEGIQYEAVDGFEGIQYKADLLLWCFNVNSVGAEGVEKKLLNVPIDPSRIYGIVTKMDRIDEEQRDRVFKRNEQHYNKYVKQLLRSSLPTVYASDSEERAEEKRRMHKETVEGIRWCIEYLLKNNASLELIKLESSAQYLQGIKQKIARKIVVFFYFFN